MYPRQDPEDTAQFVMAIIHKGLNLVPGAKVMVLIDIPGTSEPQGLFSQISYDRAHELLRAAQTALEASRADGLKAIAGAMGAARHG